MKMKTKIIIVAITIFSIIIAFIIVSNNMKFNNSLNYFKKEAFIDYILEDNIEKNRNINKICDVIVDSYKNKNELYIKKLGDNIHSSTFDAYSGEYKLSKGMKNLFDCVVNSKYVKNLNFEDKIKIKTLLHTDIDTLDDYDFDFIRFIKEDINNYIENNKVEIITEYNKGGYYDFKCPSDSKKSIPIRDSDKFAPTIFIETYEYNCYGDFMEIKYTYLEENREISPIKDKREKSYDQILYKGSILKFTNLEDAIKFKYTENMLLNI